MVTNNFCAVGGDTYNVFGRSESTFDTGINLEDAVSAYILAVLGGTVTADTYGEPQGRMTVIQ